MKFIETVHMIVFAIIFFGILIVTGSNVIDIIVDSLMR